MYLRLKKIYLKWKGVLFSFGFRHKNFRDILKRALHKYICFDWIQVPDFVTKLLPYHYTISFNVPLVFTFAQYLT
jgi:hypothetical protein